MATVTQTITSLLENRTWQRPPDPYIGNMPYGEIVATSIDEITAKGIGDIGVYAFSTILPPGWVYRLVELRIEYACTGTANLDNLNKAMEFVTTENQVTVKRFLTISTTDALLGLSGVSVRNPAITNDFVSVHQVADGFGLSSDVIDASQGQSVLLGTIVDDDAAATLAIGTVFYARFLKYTIQQYHAGLMQTAIPLLT